MELVENVQFYDKMGKGPYQITVKRKLKKETRTESKTQRKIKIKIL